MAEFGPLTFQNDDLLLDRLGSERMEKIKLLDSGSNRLFNVQDRGALYAYEIVNFVDGKRSVGEIRDAVAAEYGPIPLGCCRRLFEGLRRGEDRCPFARRFASRPKPYRSGGVETGGRRWRVDCS